nr:probable WRKY transcription factor 41 [Quercus suber]
MELAKLLEIHPNLSSSSHETREFLAEMILGLYTKAISMLNLSSSVDETQFIGSAIRMFESLADGLRSEDSDRELKNQSTEMCIDKEKQLPKWTVQVRVSSEMGLESPLDDGYSWRKYGQKDILGANYTRSYYRCTFRHSQGCLATKQVQRSDEDPTVFAITYRGRHTCAYVPSASKTKPVRRSAL